MKHVCLLWMMGLYDLIFNGILYKPIFAGCMPGGVICYIQVIHASTTGSTAVAM
jgi:hypothetical protein